MDKTTIPFAADDLVQLCGESTLDPYDWDEFRRLAHSALDEAIDSIQTVRDRPVWQPVPTEVRERLADPLPIEGACLEDVFRECKENILPYATGNVHPRFFGWV